ncbi:hypothetical protein TWF281_006655 [Arthrobotrys megalospora]
MFEVKINNEHGKTLDKISEYANITLGSDIEQANRGWIVNYTDDTQQLFFRCSAEIAEDIKARWDTVILDAQPLAPKYEPDEKGDASSVSSVVDENITPLNPGPSWSPDKGFGSLVPAMHMEQKRASKNKIQSRTDAQENCMLSKHKDSEVAIPCVYSTDSSQGKGVTVYIVDYAFATFHKDFKHVSWGRSKDHIFVDERDSLPSLLNFKNKPMLPDESEGDRDLLRRGTNVLSKLLGAKFGVARKVKPILVKTSDRNSGLEPKLDSIFAVLPKVIVDIKKKSAKFDVSAQGAPKFIVLLPGTYNLDRKTSAVVPHKAQFRQLIQELGEMPNVAVVCPADDDYHIKKTQTEGVISEVMPVNSYPALFGDNEKIFPHLVIVGGVNPRNGELESRYNSTFVRVSAPSVNINVAVPEAGKSWGGKDYGQTDGTPIAAAAVAGVLATLISARGYTIPEAISNLYQLAYPRGSSRDLEGERIFPNVVYNGFGTAPEGQNSEDTKNEGEPKQKPEDAKETERGKEEESGNGQDQGPRVTVTVTVYLPRERCVILRREITSEVPGNTATVSTVTITACSDGRTPETTSVGTRTEKQVIATPTAGFPISDYVYVYEANLCKQCLNSNGNTPIQGVLWIPHDCPCKDGDIA